MLPSFHISSYGCLVWIVNQSHPWGIDLELPYLENLDTIVGCWPINTFPPKSRRKDVYGPSQIGLSRRGLLPPAARRLWDVMLVPAQNWAFAISASVRYVCNLKMNDYSLIVCYISGTNDHNTNKKVIISQIYNWHVIEALTLLCGETAQLVSL